MMPAAATPSVTTIEQLSIHNPSYVPDGDEFSDEKNIDDDVFPPPRFDRQARPQSSRTAHSTTSRSSVNNIDGRVRCYDFHASKYFSYKDHGFEKALSNIHRTFFPQIEFTTVIRDDLMKRSWLLIDIDHWDLHREVIVILMENHILIIRYNFIRENIIWSQSIRFEDIREVTFGPYTYPDKSVMGEYLFGGIRIVHGDDPSFFARWNPTSKPNIHTFTSHHLAYNDKERETVTYNCDDFIESLDAALTTYRRAQNQPKIDFIEDKILISSYASLWSVLFNQNYLGFNRDRNGANW